MHVLIIDMIYQKTPDPIVRNVCGPKSGQGDYNYKAILCQVCFINPRRACAARVTVVVLCVCVFVCPRLFSHYMLLGGL